MVASFLLQTLAERTRKCFGDLPATGIASSSSGSLGADAGCTKSSRQPAKRDWCLPSRANSRCQVEGSIAHHVC